MTNLTGDDENGKNESGCWGKNENDGTTKSVQSAQKLQNNKYAIEAQSVPQLKKRVCKAVEFSKSFQ